MKQLLVKDIPTEFIDQLKDSRFVVILNTAFGGKIIDHGNDPIKLDKVRAKTNGSQLFRIDEN